MRTNSRVYIRISSSIKQTRLEQWWKRREGFDGTSDDFSARAALGFEE
jgi:hypothetical protein